MRNSIIPSEGAAINIPSDSAGGRVALLLLSLLSLMILNESSPFSARRPEAVRALLQCHPKYKTVCVCLSVRPSVVGWVFRDALWWYTGFCGLWFKTELKLFRDYFFHKHSQEKGEEEHSTCLSGSKFTGKRRHELSYLSSVFHIPV